MRIEEIKAKLPGAEIYELKPGAKYLLLVDNAKAGKEQTLKLIEALDKEGIRCVAARCYDAPNAIKLLELPEASD